MCQKHTQTYSLLLFWQLFIAKQRHQTCGSGALIHLSHTVLLWFCTRIRLSDNKAVARMLKIYLSSQTGDLIKQSEPNRSNNYSWWCKWHLMDIHTRQNLTGVSSPCFLKSLYIHISPIKNVLLFSFLPDAITVECHIYFWYVHNINKNINHCNSTKSAIWKCYLGISEIIISIFGKYVIVYRENIQAFNHNMNLHIPN